MPMYYFHLCDDEMLSDVDGTDLINVDAARAHATVVARELVLNTDGMLEQRWSAWTMSVHDDVGKELFSFELSDFANGNSG
jgi:hypothetical protein